MDIVNASATVVAIHCYSHCTVSTAESDYCNCHEIPCFDWIRTVCFVVLSDSTYCTDLGRHLGGCDQCLDQAGNSDKVAVAEPPDLISLTHIHR